MLKKTRPAQQLFLFDLRHAPFVKGESAKRASAVTAAKAIRQFAFLVLVISFPMIIAITLLVALMGEPIRLLLLAEIFMALVVCGYVVIRGYLRDQALHDGHMIFGEVIRQELLPGYANIGSSLATRIIYRFMTPDDERIIGKIDLSYAGHRMPDGRKYPEAGTPVAILFADQQNYKLL